MRRPGGDKRTITVTLTIAEATRLYQRAHKADRFIESGGATWKECGGSPGFMAYIRASEKIAAALKAVEE